MQSAEQIQETPKYTVPNFNLILRSKKNKNKLFCPFCNNDMIKISQYCYGSNKSVCTNTNCQSLFTITDNNSANYVITFYINDIITTVLYNETSPAITIEQDLNFDYDTIMMSNIKSAEDYFNYAYINTQPYQQNYPTWQTTTTGGSIAITPNTTYITGGTYSPSYTTPISQTTIQYPNYISTTNTSAGQFTYSNNINNYTYSSYPRNTKPIFNSEDIPDFNWLNPNSIISKIKLLIDFS